MLQYEYYQLPNDGKYPGHRNAYQPREKTFIGRTQKHFVLAIKTLLKSFFSQKFIFSFDGFTEKVIMKDRK